MRKAQILNAAYMLLHRGGAITGAVERLSAQFGLSRRQAYRYVREAEGMSAPVDVPEMPVPMTFKLPRSLVEALRIHAANSGLSMGEIVSRALAAFLRRTDG